VPQHFSHVVGFDDTPFARAWRGDVAIIGAVFAGLRLEGVLRGTVRRDGVNATARLADLITVSKFRPQLQLVLLQGIALAGFNVVDLDALHAQTGLPLLVIARRQPRMDKIRAVLRSRVPGGARKWALIERAGPMEAMAGVFVQRRGIGEARAERVIRQLAVHGSIPEPLRVAHLIAGGIAIGQSRGRT
jgi:endonuclease V-like protein UPF0215 family